MTGYTILKTENLPDSLKSKPRSLICVVFTAGMLIMTLSAIAAGVFIGYTYCYVEHRTGFTATGNVSLTQDLWLYNVPVAVTDAVSKNNTINGALMSSQVVQRLLKISHMLLDDDRVTARPRVYKLRVKLDNEI